MSDTNSSDNGMLTDEPVEGESYVKPNYIETQLSKDGSKECRGIVKTINEFGVSQRQKLYLIYLLALELENREAMIGVAKAVGEASTVVNTQQTKVIVTEGTMNGAKKLLIGNG